MFKKSLIVLLLVLSFSLVFADLTQPNFSKYTFPVITSVLENVFEEIRLYSKSFNLLPYSQDKAATLTNDIFNIIMKHEQNKEYIFRRIPVISLMVGPSSIDPRERMYFLHIMLSLYENDQMLYGKPVLGSLVIIKNIFVVSESSQPKIKT